MSRRRIAVESWDPDYGSPLDSLGLEPSQAEVDTAVELASTDWRPLPPSGEVAPATSMVFVDGVRRIDALVWIDSGGPQARAGLCASYAAGVVRIADRTARVEGIEVRRGLFSPGGEAALETSAGVFQARAVAGDDPEQLSLALQQRLGELEVSVAGAIEPGAELIVVDGPLSGRQSVPGAVGYVKTHRVTYLPEALQRVVADLAPGQRTPLFVSTTSWTRYSWYLRLPGPAAHPWAGVVRLEASADQPVARARLLAETSAITLPAYASVAHKDPRAPQNLFPIAGLERELRHRLGDPALIHRALRVAADATGPAPGPGRDHGSEDTKPRR